MDVIELVREYPWILGIVDNEAAIWGQGRWLNGGQVRARYVALRILIRYPSRLILFMEKEVFMCTEINGPDPSS